LFIKYFYGDTSLLSKLKNVKEKLRLHLVHKKYCNNEIQRFDPIVVLGMHRSGTTMLGELLSDLGVFLGDECEVHGESKFIMACNEDVLRVSHSAWDDTRNLSYLYEYPSRVAKFVEKLKNKVIKKHFVESYVGLSNANAYFQCRSPWGWKEPRTTVLWPLWKGVFPQAKFIFLYRNGVDVAESLRKREPAQINLVNKLYPSLRCMELSRAFKVWEEYNELYFDLKKLNPEVEILEVCYEHLLEKPRENLLKITRFLNLEVDANLIDKVSGEVNSNRAFSFSSNQELLDFYASVKDSPMMKKLGYEHISL
jgi:hypothetical protein